MTTPANNPNSERTWTLREAIGMLIKLLEDRNRKWSYAGFSEPTKNKSWSHINTLVQAHKHRWGRSGFINFLRRNEQDLKNIIPGEKSNSTRLREKLLELLSDPESLITE